MADFQKSAAFLNYLEQWQALLPVKQMEDVVTNPGAAAILSVDVINGFCYQGPLSSPRVAGIVEPITKLFKLGWFHGIRQIVLTQDTHEEQAVEFGQFPPHCVRGTPEGETVDAFKALPFFDRVVVLEKNSIHSGLNTGLQSWLDGHPDLNTFIVVGDCTDLCTYQLAMHLRLQANAAQLNRRVIVPADCVDTYDMPVETAASLGAFAHDGDLLHRVFLYHMALNGVEVVRRIE